MRIQDEQDGVVSRQQLLAEGITDTVIARMLRRRELTRVHAGVYVNHTGPLTWHQRAWAAVHAYWPAALAGSSALHAAGVRGHSPVQDGPIEVVIDRTRSIRRRSPGICLRQLVRYDTYCLLNTAPPRERVEHALLRVASGKAGLDASVAVLADAVQAGHTTAPRLAAALGERPRLRHRAVLLDVVGDVDAGVRSVLEHRYLTRVERAHGLPLGRRQVARIDATGTTYRDVDYVEYGVAVELDGKLHRDSARARWSDFDRDLRTLLGGEVTVRVGWGQVITPCRLAQSIAALLAARGWAGPLRPCSVDCAAFPATGEEDAAQM